jgi:hypothetical protein
MKLHNLAFRGEVLRAEGFEDEENGRVELFIRIVQANSSFECIAELEDIRYNPRGLVAAKVRIDKSTSDTSRLLVEITAHGWVAKNFWGEGRGSFISCERQIVTEVVATKDGVRSDNSSWN